MILVIGASGFLGSRLIAALSREGPAVGTCCNDRLRDMLDCDLRVDSALDRVLSMAAGKVVYFCANVGGRQTAASAPADAYRVNAYAPSRIAAVAAQFVYFSTDYVFDRPGMATEESAPSPDSMYARSKADGERAVLAASDTVLVVRISGLFDARGTRNVQFADATAVRPPDNRMSNPTFVPDLLSVVRLWQLAGIRGIRHACGPDTLSEYEFHQLASLRWGYDVHPSLSSSPRFGTRLVSSSPGAIRSPSEVFIDERSQASCEMCGDQVLVADTVGVVLSGRRWKETDPRFWLDVNSDPSATLRTLGPERVAAAYCPNPRFWRMLRTRPAAVRMVLANNGPWESFFLWQTRYGLSRIFELVINSERDKIVKPQRAFRAGIDAFAGGRSIHLIDDHCDVVTAATNWGWIANQTTLVSTWPIEEYSYPGMEAIWA